MDPILEPTSVPRGRAAHLDATRILDATEACLKEQGYDGTTIRQIAKRLNCAVGSIYRYFTDKRALLDAVTQRRFAPIIEVLEQGASFEQTYDQYRQIAAAEPEAYRLMFWLACVGRSGTMQPGLPAVIDAIIKGWAQSKGDDEAFTQWALLHGKLMMGTALGESSPEQAASAQGGAPTILVDASGQPKTPTITHES